MSTSNINTNNTMTQEQKDAQELKDFLDSYEYDANGNPRIVELESGRCVSFEELETMEEFNHE